MSKRGWWVLREEEGEITAHEQSHAQIDEDNEFCYRVDWIWLHEALNGAETLKKDKLHSEEYLKMQIFPLLNKNKWK